MIAILLFAPGAAARPFLDELLDPAVDALPPPSDGVVELAYDRADAAVAHAVDEVMDARARLEGRIVSNCERFARETQPYFECPTFLP